MGFFDFLKGKKERITDVDGNIYKTVRIGNQLWMAENLRTTNYNGGTAIPLITDDDEWVSVGEEGKGAYCYYENDPANYKKYGALYNWYAVNGKNFVPVGWHVPTDEEWTTLEEYLIANGYNWDGIKEDNKIAKSLASNTDWEIATAPGVIGNDLSKNNRTVFSAFPGGSRDDDGNFRYIGIDGNWWSTTEYDASHVFLRYLHFVLESLRRINHSKRCGFSVRLLRD